jgi:hypothetical protein
MPTELSKQFRADLDRVRMSLRAVPAVLADMPWRPDGWTRTQIVGHLLDSAANNRQRFVRASTRGEYSGPDYDQDAWVKAHGYANQPWETLLNWWETEHAVLAAVVDHIASDRLEATCIIGDGQPVTLRFLIEDYVAHQNWHLAQIRTGVPT